jgi:hypothetical protein
MQQKKIGVAQQNLLSMSNSQSLMKAKGVAAAKMMHGCYHPKEYCKYATVHMNGVIK